MRQIKAMFIEEKYLKLMNEKIKDDVDYEDGMEVISTGSGIALMKGKVNIREKEPMLLAAAHKAVVEQANKELALFEIKFGK